MVALVILNFLLLRCETGNILITEFVTNISSKFEIVFLLISISQTSLKNKLALIEEYREWITEGIFESNSLYIIDKK